MGNRYRSTQARTRRSVGSVACVLAGVVVIAAMLHAPPARGAPVPTSRTAAPKWLTWNARTHTASLTLIAGYNNAVSGYNFNGYGNGKMTVTVPVGARVNVTFSNKSAALNHGFVVTPYADRNTSGSFPVAFKGASSANPTTGTLKGKVEHHSFVANKAGKYAIVCAVPGHATSGMWDVLQVVKGGSAMITTK